MLDLSPTKLLIILIVAVVLVGPKRLPVLARQLGTGWRRLRQLSMKIDQEVRQAVPDLPTGAQIARITRSPVSFLDHLARNSEEPGEHPIAAAPRLLEFTEHRNDLLGELDDPTLN